MVNNTEHKISLFADDTSILLDGTEKSLTETLNTLEHFSYQSGLKINFDKTNIVWLGSRKFSSYSIKTKFKLKWETVSFKMLGINFHVDLEK